MSKRVVGLPKFEAKQLFDSIDDGDLFEYFFEDAIPPDGVSKDDYLKIEEARRLLGLPKK